MNMIFDYFRHLLRPFKRGMQLIGFYGIQFRNFERYAALGSAGNREQTETQLVFYSHQIEKGLSHSDFRPRFGKRPLGELSKLLQHWDELGLEWDSYAPKVALSVLRQYRIRHEELKEDLPVFFNEYFAKYSSLILNADLSYGGAKPLPKSALNDKGYDSVLTSRVSIREYANSVVDMTRVEAAVLLATHAPSVCNRQPSRVLILKDKSLITQVLEAQGGWKGYAAPPILLLITSKLSSFVHEVERNEPYVDGGVFSMALLGSLEYEDLGACPLNTMFATGQEKQIRELLGIAPDEVFIMFIAVGNPLRDASHPCSVRRSVSDIIQIM